jgi:hypothetical protein
MNMKRILITTVTAALLAAFGCTEAKPEKSEAIERAATPEPTLTSSAVTPLPTKPVEEKANEPTVIEEVPEGSTEPAEPSFEPTVESMDGITIQRFVTASEIEHREPVVQASVFGHHEEKVYAFVEASNEAESQKTLTVHFIGPDGHVSGGIELHIPPAVPRWRTWAYTKHAKKPGLWRVEIRAADGALLGALPFEVQPDC